MALAPDDMPEPQGHHRRVRRPATGHLQPRHLENQYTSQMLHVWVVPYPGGVFSDDLSLAATNSAAQAALSGK